jgi:hypothetical protein
MAKAKTAPQKKTAKKAAAKKTATPKLPFYAQLLTKQAASGLKATNKENDSMQTEKYPNDEADVLYKNEAGMVYSFAGDVTGKRKDQVVVTLKYPSDTDEAVTMKYPSDDDEVVSAVKEVAKAEFKTTRYPNDEYAAASDLLLNYKPAKGIAIRTTRPSADVAHTLKYPSDGDESILSF